MRLRWLLAPLLPGALLLAACGENKATATPPPIPTVLVTPVTKQDVPLYVEAVGSLDGYVNADIRARVRGYLQAQRYKDGAGVKEGQLLFNIEPAEYEAAVAAAKGNLARAQAAQTRARAVLERKKSLEKDALASKQDLDDAEAAARDADGQVESARAQLATAALNLSYTQIRAPVSGVAGLALVRAGNLVGQDGPTLLTTVSQVDPIRVNFPISETDYLKSPERFRQLDSRDLDWARQQFARLDAGGAAAGDDPGVELVLSDGSVYPHRGVIVTVNRQVDPSTGTIQLQALFPNGGNLLRPGQYARVRMRQKEAGANALVVPEKAVVQVQGASSLAVVGSDNKVHLRRVEVGPSAGTLRVIKGGVAAGDRVVVDGLQKAPDGATVNAQPLPDKAPAAAGTAKP